MAKMKIITGENSKELRTMCDPVGEFDDGLAKLVADMIETMKGAKGLGLAAPQVAVLKRVFLVTLAYDTDEERIVAMVNPEILTHGAEAGLGEEGCLSLPGKYGKVERYKKIKARYFDLNGVAIELELEDLDARVVQHELDHLNGILFVDRMREQEERENLVF